MAAEFLAPAFHHWKVAQITLGIAEKIGADTFFGRIRAYYDVRGWEAPGTQEQFEEATTRCWGLEIVTAEDGSKWYKEPD